MDHRKALVERWGRRGDAAYTAVASGATLLLIGLLAWLVEQPLMFASLGPTAYLVFEKPLERTSSPHHTVVGHLTAAAAGWLAVVVFGLLDAPDALTTGMTPGRAGAAAASIALTSALVVLLRAKHPPAGATTLLVSLGFMTSPAELLALGVGVLLLSAGAVTINRAAGVPVPLWGPRDG